MKKERAGEKAFTLAELMIVIVLIAILAGFLLPAVLNSQRAARVAECKSRIQAISMAIDSFHNDFGYYPPTSRAFNPATGDFDGAAFGNYNYAEALFHCLVNKWAKGAGDAVIKGKDPHLIGNAPVNSGPYLEVKGDDAVDLDHDGWYELADPWGNPYIYIPPGDYMLAGGTQYNAGALVMIDSTGDGVINSSDWPDLNVDPLESGFYHQQRFRFQLISRGEDGWTPGIDHRDGDGDGLPDGYKDISIVGNPYGSPPSATNFNPALIGTDTDLTAPFIFVLWGQTKGTADDINNWSS
ncbi:MAG: prepilin-type N-terminal cleavage/methylation domain-containing protein [Planctomycetota bacterium]